MDIKIAYSVSGDKTRLLSAIQNRVIMAVTEVLTKSIDNYISDLTARMGNIEGSVTYTDKAVRWTALEEDSLKEENTFWYESGEVKNSLTMGVQVSNNTVRAFAGIPRTSDQYLKAIWNELGFSTSDGKLVRRPLFIPLAELHLVEINKNLQVTLRQMKLEVKIPV